METLVKEKEALTQNWNIKVSPWSFVTLDINNNEISNLALVLQSKISQAPAFFNNTPIIIAFDDNCEHIEVGHINEVVSIFERYKLNILAFYGTSNWAKDLAEFFKVPLLSKRIVSKESKQTHVIDKPLRAGQQCFFDGDIIILAPIHSGAEVIAKGNIHCYNQAKGRLIAGVNGDKSAKIFTRLAEPEMISIAGIYMTKNQQPDHQNSTGKRCYYLIKNDRLIFDYCN